MIPEAFQIAYEQKRVETRPLRVAIVGASKVGKSTWILDALNAGYRLLFLDGDDSRQPIDKLTVEARTRLIYMDWNDNLAISRMATLMRRFMEESTFVWDVTKQQGWLPILNQLDPESLYMRITPTLLDTNVILVVDSWSAYRYGLLLKYFEGQTAEIMDVDKIDLSYFNPLTIQADTMLHYLHCLPCHVAVTFHPTEYVKMKKKVGKASQRMADQEVEFTKIVPRCVTKGHGMEIAKYFPDMLWLEVDDFGNKYIDARVLGNREGGGFWGDRHVLDASRSFAALAKAHGCPDPDPEAPLNAIEFFDPGEFTGEMKKKQAPVQPIVAPPVPQAPAKPLDAAGAKPSIASITGLNDLKTS